MKLEIQENLPLAPLTTLNVGGCARYFARVQNEAQVAEAVAFSRRSNLSLFVLGGGSNLLVSDRGWNGLVLQVAFSGIGERVDDGKRIFDVGAGTDWDEFVSHAIAGDCAGIECLSGIPGSTGGTPVQNVGAYGQDVSETIVSVRAFDLAENGVRNLSAAECGFSYRASTFNTNQRGRYIILSVTYSLTAGGLPRITYADLQKYFSGRVPTLAETRAAVLAIRASKGMLITPGDPNSRSAGSFFKNPVVSSEKYSELTRRARELSLAIPSYPQLESQHKISAAWLVEHSGFHKGYARGRAAISSKHALAIVNRGGATSEEIIALSDEIRGRVEQIWNVRLDLEPVLVGF